MRHWWLLLSMILMLIACGITKGTVIAKHDYPGHYESYSEPMYIGQTCTKSGSTQICTPNYIYIPRQRWEEEQWALTIKAGEDSNQISVGQTIYQQAHVGDEYDAETGELVPQ